ncbi:hypothetical protein HanXRQr2_Chr03g0097411 [Helianthus annuus]|uniref:Uncharacterized protein n=1 Tax=Helianthus annuus TaxID=4232 RepID=A0A9K3JEA4_HELAN|nr:hypothetical protein HanXRQr2_Chr03g0097411 [Helianthus annuus]KAJ0942594.1 hypothetical protein HanPSC8_Chr03g0093851 [Helianthus annuus]
MLWLVLDLIVNMLWCLGSLYKELTSATLDHSFLNNLLVKCGAQEHSPGFPNHPLDPY